MFNLFQCRNALIGISLTALLFPALLRAQLLGRESLSSFPADTQQLAYTNLADLRGLPNYAQLRQRLLNRQMASFEDFLRSMGIKPEEDTDEVLLGWRGEATDASAFFGLAAGRFQPERAHDFFIRSGLTLREYEGQDLYAFGSGEDRADWFFAFPSSSLAIFGRLGDVKAVLDARAGRRPALDSVPQIVNWEAELEGSAPQWGLTTGRNAANLAVAWLGGGSQPATAGQSARADKPQVNPAAFLGPIQAVLYHVTWSDSFTAQLSFVYPSEEAAEALVRMLKLWQESQQSSGSGRQATPAMFSQFDLNTSGSRVELNVSGPMEGLDPLLRGPATAQVH